MSITADPAQSHSRDVAIAAIAEAIEQVGHAGERPVPARPYSKENKVLRKIPSGRK